MQKIFKKLFFFALACAFFFMIGILLFFAVVSPSPLNEEEINLLKNGKKFWEWTYNNEKFKIHFSETGDGENHILLIHGFRSHTYTWKSVIPLLSNLGYHVWAFDLVGFGLSDKPTHLHYDQKLFLTQIDDFMSEKSIATADLIGNSMGGTLALEMAVNMPQKVKSVTLLNPLGYHLNMPFYLFLMKDLDFVWKTLVYPSIIEACLQSVIYNLECVTKEQVEAYHFPYRLPGGIQTSLLTMRHFNMDRLKSLHSHFKEISQPILLIWGEEDTLIPLSHYQTFLNDLPFSKNYLIPNCGHMPQEERPEEIVQLTKKFLKKI